MRINKVEITKYKNLKGFKIDFEKSYYVSVLLGKNGTGKSNLLEFLTIVFKALDLADSPSKFKDFYLNVIKQNGEKDSDFILDYTINGNKIRILFTDNDLKIRDLVRSSNISFTDFKNKKDVLFPSHVVGYYSGKNNRFEHLFESHIEKAEQSILNVKRAYDKKDAQDLKSRDEGVPIPENEKVELPVETFRTLFFANHKYSQLLLLTLFAFKDTNPAIKKLLDTYLKIDGFELFSITVKSPGFNKDVTFDDGIEKFWGVAGSSLKSISFLYRISKRSLRLPPEQVEGMNILSSKKEAVTLLIDATTFITEVIEEYKNDPAETFRHLESLYLSDLLYEIVLEVKRGDDIISFSNLSEGEQQMISTLGLMIITGTKNSLYLMDEPETHLNPKWQREYIDIIKELVDSKNNSHIMIATHSPFISQSIKDSDLILFKKEKDGTAVRKIDNMHTWNIDQILTSEIYELETTRSKDIEDYLIKRDELLRKKKRTKIDSSTLTKIDKELNKMGIGSNAKEVILNQNLDKLATLFENAGL